ncbi:DNA-binding response regulator, LuxR family [Frigoriglobus tundricola]|uniref:DNA-binding response regulator, LuxR family n=1 Tax=Frigoriglobus tundricola TaxID=2774151 RepID=A0A6M5Z633_9BACT|nr:DNA-binding response regulator, LuxR family [Frigoriglobus tundricola]
MSAARFLVADPFPVVRVGFRALVGSESGIEVAGEAADGPTAIRLCAELDPEVVVTEVALPGLTGPELVAGLRENRPGRKVFALTACEDPVALGAFMEAGAAGYVLKRSGTNELLGAIRTVLAGAIHLDPAVAGAGPNPSAHEPQTGPPELSARESEVVRLIALGYSNKEIAAQLQVSVKTVETYKTRSMEKLGTRSRVAIVRYAAERGWLTK